MYDLAPTVSLPAIVSTVEYFFTYSYYLYLRVVRVRMSRVAVAFYCGSLF